MVGMSGDILHGPQPFFWTCLSQMLSLKGPDSSHDLKFSKDVL